jgi:predicted AAA+ superfamily ATPase
MWINRTSEGVLGRLARGFPAVLVTGPRQVGKTSLLRRMFPTADYLSLDLPTTAETAKTAPESLFANIRGNVIIDEIQYAPELLRYIKHWIDQDRRNGRFLITGSQAFPLMQGVAESLAGRCGILNLQSLSYQELEQTNEQEYIFTGGFPELHTGAERDLWYPSYVATYLERDIRNLLNVVNLQDFNRFIRACALRTSQTINYTNLARDVGIAPNTARKWMSILQSSGTIMLQEPFFGNRTKRLIKSPKLVFLDTGLAAFLAGFSSSRELMNSSMMGALWESYVVGQIWRHIADSGRQPRLHFWRTATGEAEVDIIIEQAGGKIVGIECKNKEHVDSSDAKHLKSFGETEKHNVTATFIVCRTATPYTLPNGTNVLNLPQLLERL